MKALEKRTISQEHRSERQSSFLSCSSCSLANAVCSGVLSYETVSGTMMCCPPVFCKDLQQNMSRKKQKYNKSYELIYRKMPVFGFRNRLFLLLVPSINTSKVLFPSRLKFESCLATSGSICPLPLLTKKA